MSRMLITDLYRTLNTENTQFTDAQGREPPAQLLLGRAGELLLGRETAAVPAALSPALSPALTRLHRSGCRG